MPPDDDTEDIEHTALEIIYRWTCGECEEVNDSPTDVRGDLVECETCGTRARVRGDW